jgi:hypothetical protein
MTSVRWRSHYTFVMLLPSKFWPEPSGFSAIAPRWLGFQPAILTGRSHNCGGRLGLAIPDGKGGVEQERDNPRLDADIHSLLDFPAIACAYGVSVSAAAASLEIVKTAGCSRTFSSRGRTLSTS